MSKTSERVRKEWKIGDAKRDAGLTTPEDIERFDNIAYGSDPVWNLLDVYRLKEQKGKLPVLSISMAVAGYTEIRKSISFMECLLHRKGLP